MKKLLMLDLDGTVRRPISNTPHPCKPEDQKLIEGVEEVVKLYEDWAIVGITNQGGVSSGFKTLEESIEEQKITLNLCPWMLRIYFCPTYEGYECWLVDREDVNVVRVQSYDRYGSFRKPGAGMLNLAIKNFKGCNEYLYVGDRDEDASASVYANVPFLTAEVWRGQVQ